MQRFSTLVCACNNGVLPITLNPLAKAQASIYGARPTLSYHLPLLSHHIPLQRAETTS
ncbi:hypothetical protein BU23DRAFT_561303 [Bimuria novae-zelandiae CBS 107.79]|uniref:Uncharacterized protein n=1 Tax=Bimuria novae-zelandiae CBS 107.79 TaxID=1447943 RepID=A0A6A5UIU7_9PLEO|nr:hypothetical protein BU23DRAFT_561303 [Bimuria novae-zelandiae CBS 107.79]